MRWTRCLKTLTPRSIASRLRGLQRDTRAIAAVEFALVLPIALTALCGEYTLCEAHIISRKMTVTAKSIADLIAQSPSGVSSATVTAYLNASAQIAAPYSIANMAIVVAEITTDPSGNTTVTWSKTLNGTALTAGASFTMPSGMAQPNSSMIYASATYTYTPPLGYVLTGPFNISYTLYVPPTSAASVPLTD